MTTGIVEIDEITDSIVAPLRLRIQELERRLVIAERDQVPAIKWRRLQQYLHDFGQCCNDDCSQKNAITTDGECSQESWIPGSFQSVDEAGVKWDYEILQTVYQRKMSACQD